MPGKRMGLMAGLLVLLAGNGCCRMSERWCGRDRPACSPAPCCVPAAPACVPAAATCPPGTVPAGNWQRSYSPNTCQ